MIKRRELRKALGYDFGYLKQELHHFSFFIIYSKGILKEYDPYFPAPKHQAEEHHGFTISMTATIWGMKRIKNKPQTNYLSKRTSTIRSSFRRDSDGIVIV